MGLKSKYYGAITIRQLKLTAKIPVIKSVIIIALLLNLMTLS